LQSFRCRRCRRRVGGMRGSTADFARLLFHGVGGVGGWRLLLVSLSIHPDMHPTNHRASSIILLGEHARSSCCSLFSETFVIMCTSLVEVSRQRHIHTKDLVQIYLSKYVFVGVY
jgi:hypothetical protein